MNQNKQSENKDHSYLGDSKGEDGHNVGATQELFLLDYVLKAI